MGQQQLLIIILVTIIVGVSTLIAINSYDESRVRNNHEAIRQKMTEAATLAQSYYSKHNLYGGGNGSYSNISLSDLNISLNSQLGTFNISDANQNSFKLRAIPAAGDEIDLVARISGDTIIITKEPKEES
jgi:Tfp pilus assembly protein PilE